MKFGHALLPTAFACSFAYAQPSIDVNQSVEKMGYAEIESVIEKLKQQGGEFDVPSERTWKLLSKKDQAGALDALRAIEGLSLTPAVKSKVVARVTAKADLTAATKLASSGRYQGIAITGAWQNLLLMDEWDKLVTANNEPQLNLPLATLLATYRVDVKRLTQWPYDTDPRRFPRDTGPNPLLSLRKLFEIDSDPIQKMTTNLTPRPLPPGSPPPASVQAAVLSSLSGKPGCAYPLTGKQTECPEYPLSDIETAVDAASKAVESRRSDPFNPIGFMEVVKIEHRRASLSCSGTLIAGNLVLTAKHCVNESRVQDLIVLVPEWDAAELAKCNDALEKKGTYSPCVGFKPYKLDMAAEIRVPSNPSVDLAILKLAESVVASNIRSFAKVNFDTSTPSKISAVGYGDGKVVKDATSHKAIEVGWFIGVIDLVNGGLSWMHDPEKGNTASCRGDSGGPVYRGTHAGYSNDVVPRELIAVIGGAPGGNQTCGGHVVMQTSLSTPEARNWLCQQQDLPTGDRCATWPAAAEFSRSPFPLTFVPSHALQR